jgi:hypothetical protein
MSCCTILNQPVEIIGLCDPDLITVETNSEAPDYNLDRNWTEISVPELLFIPDQKPDIETLDKVYIKVKIDS